MFFLFFKFEKFAIYYSKELFIKMSTAARRHVTEKAMIARAQKIGMDVMKVIEEETGKVQSEMIPEELSAASARIQTKMIECIEEMKNNPEELPNTEEEEGTPPVCPNELLWKKYQEGTWAKIPGTVYKSEDGNPSFKDVEWFIGNGYELNGRIWTHSPDGFYDADTPNEVTKMISDPEVLQKEAEKFVSYNEKMNKFMNDYNYMGPDDIGGLPEKVVREWSVSGTGEFTLVKNNNGKMCDNPFCCKTAHLMFSVGRQLFPEFDFITWYLKVPMYTMDNQEDLCGLCVNNAK